MSKASRSILACCLAAALPFMSGCVTFRETQPAHTATEELLMSHAAELAAAKLAAALPNEGAVWIDASHFKGDGSDYALSAVRGALMRRGLTLVPEKKASHITVELRLGALSIDQQDAIFGLPAGYLPIPGTVSAFPIPELSLYSEWRRTGVAEFSAFAYDTATRAPIAFAGPAAGERSLSQKKYLTVFTFGSRVERPGAIDGRAPKR